MGSLFVFKLKEGYVGFLGLVGGLVYFSNLVLGMFFMERLIFFVFCNLKVVKERNEKKIFYMLDYFFSYE